MAGVDPEIFDDDYLYFYAPGLDERADGDAALITRLLDLRPGARVLDVPCGHGRIANRLAARGFSVTGIDLSDAFLAEARAGA